MPEGPKNRLYRTLRWSERYTKTDMVYLFKGGFWMVLGQAGAAVVAFGLAVAFANLIPRDTYGYYKYVLSLGALIGTFSLSGIGTFVTQSVGKGLEGALRYSFWLTLRWSIPVSLLAFGAAGYYAFQNNTQLAFSLIIVAIFTPLLNSAQLYTSFLGGKRDFKRAARYNFFTSAFQALCLVTALFFNVGALMLVFVYFASNTAAALLFYLLTLHTFKPNAHFNQTMAKLGVNLSMASIAGTLVSQLDKVLIFHYLGAGPVAVYTLAQAPVIQLRAILKLSTPLSLPKLTALDRATVAKTLEGKLDRFLIGIIVMTVGYIALAPIVFPVFFPKYVDSIPYSQAYALLLLLFPKKLIPLALFAQEEKRGLYPLTVSTPIVQIALLFILVPLIGLWGAVVAEVGGSLASNILANYYLMLFKRGSKVHTP